MSAADKDAAAPGDATVESPRSLRELSDLTRPDADTNSADVFFEAQADVADFGDAAQTSDAIEEPEPQFLTPAQAIARGALDAALPADVRVRLAADTPIAVVVAVPGADWVDEIRVAFGDLTSGHKHISRDGSQRREHLPSKGNFEVGAWLAGGRHVLGVSQAPSSLLPSTLLAVADATIEVRPPNGATLAYILRLTGRTPPPEIPDAICAGMSFAEILAAFRHGFDGSGVVAALKRLVVRKTGLEEDDGVPPLPDLPGHSGEARVFGMALLRDFAEWRAGRRAWRDVPASAILAGPPGTGKTLFARSLAKALGVPIFANSMGDFFARTEGHLGDIAKAFQDSWDLAMNSRPCLYLLDELDSVPDRNSLSTRAREWWTPIVTLILTTTDGVQSDREGLVLIGCTNHGNRLDSALVRRGRFDRIIPVDLPTPDDLAAIVSHHLGGTPSAQELLPATRLARGASAADAASWAREARSISFTEGRVVAVADVAAAVAPPDPRTPEVLRRCAIHEAGHAVVDLRLGARVESVSIVMTGSTGGSTMTVHRAAIATAAEVERIAIGSLGGRAAEQVLLGAPSAGAVGDLAACTSLIASYHATVGLGDSLVHRASNEDALALLNVDPQLRKTVETHLARLYAEALAIVQADEEAILRVAEALLARRFLTGDEAKALVDSVGPMEGAP